MARAAAAADGDAIYGEENETHHLEAPPPVLALSHKEWNRWCFLETGEISGAEFSSWRMCAYFRPGS